MVAMDKYEPGSLRTYLVQMGDIPLLSRSEESVSRPWKKWPSSAGCRSPTRDGP